MGCGDTCPFFPGRRYVDWDLDDPAGQECRRGAPGARRDRAAGASASRGAARARLRLMNRPALARRALAEALGTGLLVVAVVGSGIMAARLSPGDTGLQLLENSDRHRVGPGRPDPRFRAGVRRAPQPGRSRSPTGGSGAAWPRVATGRLRRGPDRGRGRAAACWRTSCSTCPPSRSPAPHARVRRCGSARWWPPADWCCWSSRSPGPAAAPWRRRRSAPTSARRTGSPRRPRSPTPP